jgi:hypothetical protein
MKELIDKNLKYLTQITKEEADFAAHILAWDDMQRFAFLFAKKIFEEEINDNKSKTE